MVCRDVLKILSEYFDEALDAEITVQVSQHLDQCDSCRREYGAMAAAYAGLRIMRGITAPQALRRLVQLRIAGLHRDPWRVRLRHALRSGWLRIRNTESTWYVTRALGTVATSAFFFIFYFASAPLYVSAEAPAANQVSPSPDLRYAQLVGSGVLEKLGLAPAQPQKGSIVPNTRIAKSDPAINDQYLSHFGQSISQEGNDYNFSVVAYVDSSGMAKIQNVIEYPNAQSFMDDFNKVISSGRFAPARKNGDAVASHMVLMFSKISVYN